MSSTAIVEALTRGIDALVGDDVAGLSDVDSRERLLGLLEVARRLHGQLVRQVDVFDARGLSVADGCRSTAGWLRTFGRMSEGAAGDLVRGARVLRDLPELSAVSRDGGLSAEQVRHVTRLVERVGADVVAGVEPTLVEAAGRWDAGDFGRACGRVRAQADPDGDLAEAGRDFARRGITLARWDGMVVLRGQLDLEGGAALVTALDAAMSAPGAGETRTPAQRRADALVELARGALTGGRLPAVGGVRPQVGVLVTPDQLAGGPPAGRPDREPPWVEWVGEVPAPVAQRIACDADVWRVVLDPKTGRPTEVGRSVRLVPAWLRKALYARDRGCRFPGCRAPAAWTDAHHLHPWSRGGSTDADNLILLCRFHHGLVHEGGWAIRLDTGTGRVNATRPDGKPYEITDHLRRPADHAA